MLPGFPFTTIKESFVFYFIYLPSLTTEGRKVYIPKWRTSSLRLHMRFYNINAVSIAQSCQNHRHFSQVFGYLYFLPIISSYFFFYIFYYFFTFTIGLKVHFFIFNITRITLFQLVPGLLHSYNKYI